MYPGKALLFRRTQIGDVDLDILGSSGEVKADSQQSNGGYEHAWALRSGPNVIEMLDVGRFLKICEYDGALVICHIRSNMANG